MTGKIIILIIVMLGFKLTKESKLRIGMCPYHPVVFCEENYVGPVNDDFDGVGYLMLVYSYFSLHSNYSDLIQEMGWTDQDYELICNPNWTSMIDSVYSGEYDFAMGAVTITSSRITEGMKFSQPTFDTGSTLLIKSHFIYTAFFELTVL